MLRRAKARLLVAGFHMLFLLNFFPCACLPISSTPAVVTPQHHGVYLNCTVPCSSAYLLTSMCLYLFLATPNHTESQNLACIAGLLLPLLHTSRELVVEPLPKLPTSEQKSHQEPARTEPWGLHSWSKFCWPSSS